MPTIRLTQAAAEKLSPPKSGRVEYFDSHLPGFGLRISAAGARSWVVFYRVGSPPRLRRYTIGSFATYPKVEAARDRARAVLQDVDKGIDPAEAKAAEATRPADTVAMLAGEFIERYAKPKNRSWAESEKTLKRHIVSRWGKREAASITRRDVLDLLDELVDKGNPIAANRVLATVRKMFGWAVERDILAASPVVNIKAPAREVERDRVLTDDELKTIWAAAEKAGGVPGAFFKTLILTGQRRDEVATMRWDALDLDARVWTLPRDATKGDRSHEVPLSPLAIKVLTAVPRTGEFVFSRARVGKKAAGGKPAQQRPSRERPISGYSKMKAAIAEEAGFTDWRIHDLRRTAGTGMARAGIAVSVISRVLNHKEGGVTKIYNRYSYLDEKRHALETWARKVETLVKKSPANVVEMRAVS